MNSPTRQRPAGLAAVAASGSGSVRTLGDPLLPVMRLAQRELRIGAVVGVIGTLALHGVAATNAARSYADMRAFSSQVLDIVRLRLGSEVDIDTLKPPPPPPPPPPTPEPEPPPAQHAAPKVHDAAPPPPPAPAQAGKVLTQEPDPNEPVDLTGEGFVTGNADHFAGGITNSKGTSTQAVRNVDAVPTGVPGGTGKPAPPAPTVDLSKPALPASSNWDCGFPPEADIEGINEATVTIVVTVGPDGRAQSVSVLKDPGNGFGRWARQCAMRKPFAAGLDRNGQPVTKTTQPMPIRFRR